MPDSNANGSACQRCRSNAVRGARPGIKRLQIRALRYPRGISMDGFQLWAQPWWVNLLFLVPALSYLFWWRKGLQLSSGNLLTLALFGASFGFVEAAVVVYLRAAAGVSGQFVTQSQPTYPQLVSSLDQFPQVLRTTEVFREAATMIMLGSVAVLAGARARERWGSFLFAFAAWDITYYVGLWAILRWPSSLKDYDVLFLIPVPWVAQV
jgi:hypothetical protein